MKKLKSLFLIALISACAFSPLKSFSQFALAPADDWDVIIVVENGQVIEKHVPKQHPIHPEHPEHPEHPNVPVIPEPSVALSSVFLLGVAAFSRLRK